MFKSFTIKGIVFIALMGALLFVVNFSLGAGIIVISGIPASSGFITGLTNLIFITLTALIIRKFGSVTLMYVVYGLLAIPTPMAGGAPGLVWKVIPLIISAFLLEIPLYAAKYKKLGFIIGVPVLIVVGAISYVLFYVLLGLPEADKFLKAIPIMLVAFTILGYIGTWLGFVIYNKIKNKSFVRQLSS